MKLYSGPLSLFTAKVRIALNDAGAPAAYWLFRQHPGAAWMMPSGSRTSEPVPARDVLHVYRKRRPGQLRDVSWLAPALLRLRDLVYGCEPVLPSA